MRRRALLSDSSHIKSRNLTSPKSSATSLFVCSITLGKKLISNAMTPRNFLGGKERINNSPHFRLDPFVERAEWESSSPLSNSSFPTYSPTSTLIPSNAFLFSSAYCPDQFSTKTSSKKPNREDSAEPWESIAGGWRVSDGTGVELKADNWASSADSVLFSSAVNFRCSRSIFSHSSIFVSHFRISMRNFLSCAPTDFFTSIIFLNFWLDQVKPHERTPEMHSAHRMLCSDIVQVFFQFTHGLYDALLEIGPPPRRVGSDICERIEKGRWTHHRYPQHCWSAPLVSNTYLLL